jgi:hypothetical protein
MITLTIERHLIDENYADEQLEQGTHLLDPEVVVDSTHLTRASAMQRMADIAAQWGCEPVPEPDEGDDAYAFCGPEEGERQGYAWLRPTVFVAMISVVDSECYADGADVAVTAHSSRDGAAAAVAARLRVLGVDGAPSEISDDGEFVEDDRFEYRWTITESPVLP